MLQRVDVYKTNPASLIEGGIAGTIDVRTRHPFDSEGLHINGNIRGVYSDKSKATDPDLGATISNTWDVGGGQFGALLGASYQPRNYHEERAFNVAPEDQSFRFGPTNPAPVPDLKGPFVMGQIPIAGDRRRTAFNAAFEWRPNDATRLYAEGFSTDYKNEFELDFFVGLPWLGNGDMTATVIPGTNQLDTLLNHDVFTITSTQANRVRSETRQFALGGSWENDNGLTLSADISRTTSKLNTENPIMDVGTVVPEVFVDTNHNGTSLLNYGGPNYDITDGRNFDIINWFDNYGHDAGDSIDGRMDLVWKPASAGLITSVGAGRVTRIAKPPRSIRSAAPPIRSRPPDRVLAGSR